MKLKDHTPNELRRIVREQRTGLTNKSVDLEDEQRALDRRRRILDEDQAALNKRRKKVEAEFREVEKAEILLEDYH